MALAGIKTNVEKTDGTTSASVHARTPADAGLRSPSPEAHSPIGLPFLPMEGRGRGSSGEEGSDAAPAASPSSAAEGRGFVLLFRGFFFWIEWVRIELMVLVFDFVAL